jgi:hypothetical protein
MTSWQDWLSQINNDLSTVYLYRAIWTTMAQTIDGNLTIPRTPALGMIASNYATTQAVAARRLADLGRDTISFARLLTEIIAKRGTLTARSARRPARSWTSWIGSGALHTASRVATQIQLRWSAPSRS